MMSDFHLVNGVMTSSPYNGRTRLELLDGQIQLLRDVLADVLRDEAADPDWHNACYELHDLLGKEDKTSPFEIHVDPHHAWLKVTSDDIEAVGLCSADFSRFSYRDGGILYLEEDCDLGRFADAYKKVNGAAPPMDTIHVDGNAIRDLEQIR